MLREHSKQLVMICDMEATLIVGTRQSPVARTCCELDLEHSICENNIQTNKYPHWETRDL